MRYSGIFVTVRFMTKNDEYRQYNKIKVYFFFAALLIGLPALMSLYKGHSGRVLVATRDMPKDSYFSEAVIYIFDHSIWGAQGIILNRPMDKADQDKYQAGDDDILPAHIGGPVGFPNMRLIAVHRANAASPWRAQRLYIGFENDKDWLLHDDAQTGVVGLFLGYVGWAPRQLEAEINHGVWRVLDADDVLGLSVPNEALWADLIRVQK